MYCIFIHFMSIHTMKYVLSLFRLSYEEIIEVHFLVYIFEFKCENKMVLQGATELFILIFFVQTSSTQKECYRFNPG